MPLVISDTILFFIIKLINLGNDNRLGNKKCFLRKKFGIVEEFGMEKGI